MKTATWHIPKPSIKMTKLTSSITTYNKTILSIVLYLVNAKTFGMAGINVNMSMWHTKFTIKYFYCYIK